MIATTCKRFITTPNCLTNKLLLDIEKNKKAGAKAPLFLLWVFIYSNNTLSFLGGLH